MSHVRVHTDSRADELSSAVGATAFTSGENIFFKRGSYSPHTQDGQRRLAHEATHVAQQTSVEGGSKAIQCDRDPNLNYIRIYSDHNHVTLSYDPAIALDESQLYKFIRRSEIKVGEMLGSVNDGQLEWEDFRQNLKEWVRSGFDGMLSVTELFSSAEEEQNAPENLVDQTMIGVENEIRTALVRKPLLDYDMTIAKTQAKVKVQTVNRKGKAATKQTSWPLLRIAADQVKEKRQQNAHGIVELVFGPTSLKDKADIARRARVSRFFEQSFAECGEQVNTFAAVMQRFNAKLEQASANDADIIHYQVTVAPDGNGASAAYERWPANQGARHGNIAMALRGLNARRANQQAINNNNNNDEEAHGPHRAIQTNLEVPLRKIGDLNDETIPALFNVERNDDDEVIPNRKEAKPLAMFSACRVQANEIVDDLLVPIAMRLHGKAYTRQSMNLGLLRSIFTLALFNISLPEAHATKKKGAYPILPKSGWGDLVRETLNPRDQAVLFQLINPQSWRAFYDDLVARANTVRVAGGMQPFVVTNVLDDEASLQFKANMAMFMPDANRQRWGTTFGGYQSQNKKDDQGLPERVNWSGRDITGTVSGKPLKTTYRYARQNGVLVKDPKIVLEIRREDHPVNQMEDALMNDATLDLNQQEAYQRMLNAAESGPLDPKMVRSQGKLSKSSLLYPDEPSPRYLQAGNNLIPIDINRLRAQLAQANNQGNQPPNVAPVPNNVAPVPNNVAPAPVPLNNNVVQAPIPQLNAAPPPIPQQQPQVQGPQQNAGPRLVRAGAQRNVFTLKNAPDRIRQIVRSLAPPMVKNNRRAMVDFEIFWTQRIVEGDLGFSVEKLVREQFDGPHTKAMKKELKERITMKFG